MLDCRALRSFVTRFGRGGVRAAFSLVAFWRDWVWGRAVVLTIGKLGVSRGCLEYSDAQVAAGLMIITRVAGGRGGVGAAAAPARSV
jgi:hypothetical protein